MQIVEYGGPMDQIIAAQCQIVGFTELDIAEGCALAVAQEINGFRVNWKMIEGAIRNRFQQEGLDRVMALTQKLTKRSAK